MGLLRLWLAFTVLRFHTTAMGSGWMPNGQAAVEAFFVLSGFAMAMVLEEKYQGALRRFWIQRFLKLWPAYIAALLLSLAFEIYLWNFRQAGAGVVQEFSGGPSPSFFSWVLIAFSNLSLIGQDLMILLGLNGQGRPVLALASSGASYSAIHYMVIPQAWSLSIELIFYALAPWYVRLSSRSLVAIAGAGILLRLAFIAADGSGNAWAYRVAPIELPTFALGILSWRAYRAMDKAEAGPLAPWRSLAGWALMLLAPQVGGDMLLQSLALALATALALPWIFSASRRFSWDQSLGEWAYPLYLLHHLLSYLGTDIARHLGVTPRFWVLALASLAASALFWKLLQAPISALRRRLLKPVKGESFGS